MTFTFLFLYVGFGGRGILPGVATGSQTGKIYVVYSFIIYSFIQ